MITPAASPTEPCAPTKAQSGQSNGIRQDNNDRPVLHLINWLKDLLPDEPRVHQQIESSVHENPLRIDDAYRELLSGYQSDPREILKVTVEIESGSFLGSVETRNVNFLSICAHHFLPFFGTVDLTYVPGPYILGLGKIPRLITARARRMQLQEFLVKELAEDMLTYGRVREVEVVARARHLCICYRGPNEPSTDQVTRYRLRAND